MSTKRIEFLIVLWIGIIIFVLMGIFPPTATRQGRRYPYAPIVYEKLIIQWILVVVVTGGLLYSIKAGLLDYINAELDSSKKYKQNERE